MPDENSPLPPPEADQPWKPPTMKAADPFSETQAMQRRFGKDWRKWLWVKEQFSRVSLAVIGSLVLTFAGYMSHMESRFTTLENDIRMVSHDMPKADNSVASEVTDLRVMLAGIAAQQTAQEKHLDANDDRIDSIYQVFDPQAVKELRPFSKRNRK